MVKPQPDFALDELIATLEELTEEEEDSRGFFTTTEICEKRGWERRRVRTLLNKAKKEGRLEIGKKRTIQLNNVVRGIDAYRIKPKEEERSE